MGALGVVSHLSLKRIGIAVMDAGMTAASIIGLMVLAERAFGLALLTAPLLQFAMLFAIGTTWNVFRQLRRSERA
ncbi:hypothetical protein [Terrarubrum flagellatum]|uniref:hypothetical protein n=1 Tax=Terrirubrum flagellatum TaxID=2895980 RepID=UPI0031451F67